jgi:hypothetical protein
MAARFVTSTSENSHTDVTTRGFITILRPKDSTTPTAYGNESTAAAALGDAFTSIRFSACETMSLFLTFTNWMSHL